MTKAAKAIPDREGFSVLTVRLPLSDGCEDARWPRPAPHAQGNLVLVRRREAMRGAVLL